jgi:hypothetical protein
MAEDRQTAVREGKRVGHRDTERTERTATPVDLPFCAIYNAFSPMGSPEHK